MKLSDLQKFADALKADGLDWPAPLKRGACYGVEDFLFDLDTLLIRTSAPAHKWDVEEIMQEYDD